MEQREQLITNQSSFFPFFGPLHINLNVICIFIMMLSNTLWLESQRGFKNFNQFL